MAINDKLGLLSLFSGCGGMDIGFEGGFLANEVMLNDELIKKGETCSNFEGFVKVPETRFQTIFANDILPEAKLAWVDYFDKRKRPSNLFHMASIVELVEKQKNGLFMFPSKVDILTGGFPCQDFSIAGKRRGFDSHKDHAGRYIEADQPTVETRGKLYMWLRQVVEITKPKVFIAENVKGLVNLSNVKDIIQSDFSEIDGGGYIVLNPRVLHAADYGIPQNRERVFFVGLKKSALKPAALNYFMKQDISGNLDPYPKPTHNFKNRNQALPDVAKLGDVLSKVLEPEQSSDLSQKYFSKAKFMGKHCQGQIEVNLDGIAPTIRSEHHGNIEFRRLSVANGGKNDVQLGKSSLDERRLTPRECALIQSFPPDYNFVTNNDKGGFKVSPSSAYKIIGNAVPPLLAYHFAIRLEAIWDELFKE